jgi:glycine cleavage system pyridoxal-binding protein P
MKSTRTGLTLGLLAGAALAAFAVSKVGKNSIKKLSERTAELKDSLNNQLTEIRNLKKAENGFI